MYGYDTNCNERYKRESNRGFFVFILGLIIGFGITNRYNVKKQEEALMEIEDPELREIARRKLEEKRIMF